MTLLISPPSRWSAAIGELPGSSKIMLYGGRTLGDGSPSNPTNGYLGDTWLFQTNNTWTFVGNSLTSTGPSPRSESICSYDGATVSLFGGTDGISNLSDYWQFSGGSNTWTKVATTPYSSPTLIRAGAMCYNSGASEAVAFGGITSWQHTYNLDTWALASNSFMQLQPTTWPTGRKWHSMASNGTVSLMYGGFNFDGALGGEIWSFSGSTWTKISAGTPSVNAPKKRYGANFVYDASINKFILFFGVTIDGNYSNEVWQFNLGTATWQNMQPTGNVPSSRAFAAACYNSGFSGNTLVFGGKDGQVDYNDTYLYNSGTNSFTKL